ncbi:MAG: alpha-L-fucosidase, partial [Clostridia bacterium]|nr:alpha-L-fucosidase [Clostridia bacterium]
MMGDMIKNGVHASSREEKYVWPTDPLIRERLEWFRDQKLALMMHFGPYSQMGMDASWSLSKGDAWARKNVDWESDVDVYRQQYIDLNKTFNPMRIQPDKWAEFAAENGFKYLIFTTKHHDGFCMFDTKYTDYKITSPNCPFHTHKYANIAREVFDAFRAKGIAIAAYFSKPDWNCPWYWAPNMETPVGATRFPNYKLEDHPEIWEQFIDFTHNQIMELMREYGKIDILWLDGGQVKEKRGLGIRMSELIAKAREVQPW